MLAKLSEGENEKWDLFLYQALAIPRFSINETRRYSSYCMVLGRDVMLSIDNLQRPQRKYMCEDFHRIMIEQQHSIFVQARNQICRAQKKCNEKVNKNKSGVKFEVGDPVFYRAAHVRQGKLNQKWRPYYRIVEQTGQVTFKFWDQLRNKVKIVHVNDIK